MKAGFGTAPITPRGGKTVIAGQIPVRYTDKVHDDIYATAMVLENGGVRTIWVSCDMCHPTKRLTDDVIQRLKEKLRDFKEDELILSATHSTAGFYLTDDEFLNSAFDVDESIMMNLEDTRRQVCDGIVSAVLKAVSGMRESTAEFAASDIITGFCRRALYKNGKAVMYGDTSREDFWKMEYPDGSGIQIIYFYTKKEHKLSGIYTAVPCPAQADENSEYITADYWAVVRDIIKKELGDVAVFGVCRAAGELSPHRLLSIDGKYSEAEWGYSAALRVGRSIAEAVLREKERPLRVFEAESLCHSRITKEIPFPVRKPSREELENAKRYFDFQDENGNPDEWMEKANAKHSLKAAAEKDFYKARISVLRLGEMLFFTAPAELFTEFSKRICARFPQNPVFDIQLTNDTLGYLPTKEAVEHGGYSTMIFSTVTTPEGGDVYVNEITKLLSSLLEEERQ